MKIYKVDGSIEERPVTSGDVIGKKTLLRTNENVYLCNPIQHPGEHNVNGSKEARMYVTGDLLVVPVQEWKSL